jgi:hypothetical protein
MKRNFLMMAFVCLFTVAALSSCSKDDDDTGNISDNTVVAVVENDSSYPGMIDIVQAEIWSEDGLHVLASAEYKNGGFSLTLPESVNDRYLDPFDEDYIPEAIKISNWDVKTGWIYLEAYNTADVNVGYFYHKTGGWEGELVYASGNVSITGSYTEEDDDGDTRTEKYNLNLKKGWNIVYANETKTGNAYTLESTSTTPAGAKWYFYAYSNESSVSGSRVKTPSLSSKYKIRF